VAVASILKVKAMMDASYQELEHIGIQKGLFL